MRSCRTGSVALAVAIAAIALGGCRDEQAAQTPPMLRVRFETEMKAILRDVKAAQETAAVTEGGYLELDRLRGRFLNRPVPDTYRLTLSEVSSSGYTAEIEHLATGLSCRLRVGGSATGVATCR